MSDSKQVHSSEQFGEHRDFWWNSDFLDLMASRWALNTRSSLLDVGCGICHWSALLLPRMASGSRFVGIDYEERWVQEGKDALLRRVDHRHLSSMTFIQSDAHGLPLEDDQFDLVTCQTVLMHLKQPERAVAEMRRVLKPGGLVVCVEPNNFFNYVSSDSINDEESLDDVADRYKLWLAYQRGRKNLGFGDNSFGDRLVDVLNRAGFGDVNSCLSDKVRPLVAPYSSPEEQAWIRQLKEWKESRQAFFNREEVFQYAIEGGAQSEFIEAQLNKAEDRFDRVLESIDAGTYSFGGGCLTYLTWGRKL